MSSHTQGMCLQELSYFPPWFVTGTFQQSVQGVLKLHQYLSLIIDEDGNVLVPDLEANGAHVVKVSGLEHDALAGKYVDNYRLFSIHVQDIAVLQRG